MNDNDKKIKNKHFILRAIICSVIAVILFITGFLILKTNKDVAVISFIFGFIFEMASTGFLYAWASSRFKN